jgi:hypothetical protein
MVTSNDKQTTTTMQNTTIPVRLVTRAKMLATIGITALAALAGLPTLTSAAPALVFSGSTFSSGGQTGCGDYTVAANTDIFRGLGGRLYIHPNGWAWGNSTVAQQQAARALFTSAPMLEASYDAAAGTGSPYNFYKACDNDGNPSTVGAIYTVCVNFLETTTTANVTAVRNTFSSKCSFIATICTPNGGDTVPGGAYDLKNYPFSHSHWNSFRDTSLKAGSISVDPPPGYYWRIRNADYRKFVADSINWGNQNNLKTIVHMYPGNSTSAGFDKDTFDMIADLRARGAKPTAWAFNNYSPTPATAPCPPGSERTPGFMNYTVLRVLQSELSRSYNLSGTKTIKCKDSGLVVGVTGGLTTQGAAVVQTPSTGASDQKWTFTLNDSDGSYTIKNVKSGLVMDVQGISTANGAVIHQWPSIAGALNQRWWVTKNSDGTYNLISVNSSKVLDVPGFSKQPVQLQQWDLGGAGGTANQHWTIQ